VFPRWCHSSKTGSYPILYTEESVCALGVVAGGGRAVLLLDPGMRDVGAASELLRPCDARLMRCYPVSTRINRVANDDEECSAPGELAEIQNSLFSQWDCGQRNGIKMPKSYPARS
jgi:hypothetical protein